MDENIKSLSQEIIKLSTFPNEILMPFLINCISLYENESFIHRNVMLSYDFNFVENVMPVYLNYSLIFPERIKDEEENIEKTFFVSKMPYAYKELFGETNSKHLIIPNEYETTLIYDDNLNPYLKKFPYLKRIAFILANTRLLEPDMSLQDILDNNLEMEKIFVEDLKEVEGPKKELK